MKLLVTCEHGGKRIPSEYWPLFRKHRALLDSHRGYDPGALALARDVARAFDAELVYSTTSRLLVELNRSRGHRQVFSEVTRKLPAEERQRLLEQYYEPYREWVDARVHEALEDGSRIVHVSCHTFTPVLDGVTRRADIGLLYDPKRAVEARLCARWQEALERADARLMVRRNYPYRGTADGLTTGLRRRYPDPNYAGIEVEVNQSYPLGESTRWRTLRKTLVATLGDTLRGIDGGMSGS